ncbi:IclR family transcriptional regulator [Aeromicrobium sp. Leaf350]|uniref:IclR family transcriptional regulator n=1 Tax=Aeromicrobium sp. Leaf350 TaxID=2876565 RepID=UPI001E2A83B0|nr:IclR family transcriptional regulator [Aeromicrobium sp. Leaf350]
MVLKSAAPSQSSVPPVQSVERAADILLAFTAANPALMLGELADAVALPLSSTHRIARTLVERGFLRQDEKGAYALGSRLLELGGLVSNTSTLSRLSAGVIRTVADHTGEALLLGEVDWIDNTVLITQKRESTHELNVTSPVGKRSGLGSGCIGKAVLSGLPEEEVELLLPNIHLVKRANRSITDSDELRRHVDRARKRGWASESDEYIAGVSGIAVPVGLGGRPLGAVSIILPTARASATRLNELGKNLSGLVQRAIKSAQDAESSGAGRKLP